MKLCSIGPICNVFVEISAKKRQIWASEHHFGEVRSDARPCLMAHWKAHVRLSICISLSELFSLSITVPELWGEMCTARLFHRGQPLCTQLLYGEGRLPSTILGIKKPEALCYPVVRAASFCVTSFWHNTGVWQTDGRTDRRICCPQHIQRLQS